MAKEQLPEFKNQTGVRGQVAVPNIQGAAASIALQPNMLAEIATNLAMRASATLAEKQGYEAGLKPQGDLGMPLTATDATFQNAYYNQAQATIGLKGSEMLQKAQLDLANKPSITPEMVNSYHANMKEGYESLLENAPSKVKPALNNQFNASLLQSMGSISTRLIRQQHKEMQDQTKLYNQNQTKELFENGVAGNDAAGFESLKDFQTRTDENIKNGIMSPLEGQAAKDGAKLSLYSGVWAKKAGDARGQQKLEPFLNDMTKPGAKPKNLSEGEWLKVQRNTLSYVQNLDTMQSKENNLIVSNLTRQMVEFGTVNPADLAEAEKQLPPATFNNVMTSMLKSNNRQVKKTQQLQALISGWNNTSVFSKAGGDLVDIAYESQVEKVHQENPNKDIWEIETETALSAAGAVPEYTRELSNKLNSSQPADIEQGIRAYDVMSRNNPHAIKGLDKQTVAMRSAYMGRIAQGRDPVTAAEEAYQVVYNKDQDQRDLNNHNYSSYINQHNYMMPNKRLNFAMSLSSAPWFAKISNPTAFSNRVMAVFEDNYKLLNGDANQAKEMTSQAIKQNFGSTYVNGQHEFSYMPIEKVANLPANAAPVIQADMAKQAGLQFKVVKDLYDKDSTYHFYYELQEKANPKSSDALKVHRVYRDGHREEFDLTVQPSSLVSMSNDPATPVVGDYDFMLRDKKKIQPFSGIGALARNVVYRPNISELHENYMKYFDLKQPDMKKVIQDYIDKEVKRKKDIAQGADIFNPFQLF